ncbi:hypothetical protein V8C44DRAFT_323668 [Trichoderma aethiopicum]
MHMKRFIIHCLLRIEYHLALGCLASIPAWAMRRGPGKSTDCSCSSNNIALITSPLAADFGIATLLDACWRTEIQWKMETAKCP